jgi:hypothetical protein
MTTIESMCEAANLHLRRSIGTSAGMHKAALRRKAEVMRAADPAPLPVEAEPSRRSAWPFQVAHHPV